MGNHHQNATFSSGCVAWLLAAGGLRPMRTWRCRSGALDCVCVRHVEVGLGMRRQALKVWWTRDDQELVVRLQDTLIFLWQGNVTPGRGCDIMLSMRGRELLG